MRKPSLMVFLVLLDILFSANSMLAQESKTPIVQAILFYHPNCPHCHEVMENGLPPIKEKFRNQFQLVGIDTSHQKGSKLYEDAVVAMSIPQDRLGVPTLVIGDIVLVGGEEIPERLPSLIEEGLANGGIGWPAIPGLEETIPNLPPSAGPQDSLNLSTEVSGSGNELISEASPDIENSPPEDSTGYSLGWIVMAAMVAALAYAVIRLLRKPQRTLTDPVAVPRFQGWTIPILSVAGLGIASYLAYVEITRIEAVCGPIGECNIVQSSPYAQILGIPVAVLGFMFYLAIVSLWLLMRFLKTTKIDWIPILLLIATFAGLLFSIYLTAMELFVIGAICAWCLSSAVVTTLLFLFTVIRLTGTDAKPPETQTLATHTG